MKRSITITVAAITALLTSAVAPAPVQDSGAPGWIATNLRKEKAVLASASFDNGITLMARCMDNMFGLILTGLPEVAEGERARTLILIVGDSEERPYVWSVAAANRGTALSRVPAVIARQLVKGGRLQIIIPAEAGGRRTRYVVNLPQSGEALEQVLTVCGKPLVDPRDEKLLGDGGTGLTGQFKWTRVPTGVFPSGPIANMHTGGTATVSCEVLPTGRVTDCEIEDEFPVGAGFGRAARQSAVTGRVGWGDEAEGRDRPFEGGRIVFTTNFRIVP